MQTATGIRQITAFCNTRTTGSYARTIHADKFVEIARKGLRQLGPLKPNSFGINFEKELNDGDFIKHSSEERKGHVILVFAGDQFWIGEVSNRYVAVEYVVAVQPSRWRDKLGPQEDLKYGDCKKLCLSRGVAVQ